VQGASRRSPETCAGRVEEDAVELLRHPLTEEGAILNKHLGRIGEHGKCPAHQLGARGSDLVGDENRSAFSRIGGEQRSLTAGAGTQVEPALPRDDRPGATERERGELRSLVLHPGTTLVHGGPERRVSPVAQRGVRGIFRLLGAPDLRDGREPWQRDKTHPRGEVVGYQQLFQLRFAAFCGQGLAEGAHDPEWMRVFEREALVVVTRLRHHPVMPG